MLLKLLCIAPERSFWLLFFKIQIYNRRQVFTEGDKNYAEKIQWTTRQLSYQSIWIKAGYRLFRVRPWHHYCLLFRAIQLLLLFLAFLVRLRTVPFSLRIRRDIFSGCYMHLQHLRYTSGFCPCTVPFVFGCMAVHIFFPPLVTADCTGWYSFLPVLQNGSRTS